MNQTLPKRGPKWTNEPKKQQNETKKDRNDRLPNCQFGDVEKWDQ